MLCNSRQSSMGVATLSMLNWGTSSSLGFSNIFVSRDSLRWTQRPPPRRSTWRTCRSTDTRTQPTNISRLHPPKVFLSTRREEGVNLALDRWELLKLYSSCKRNHKPCHDWSQRKNENSNYFLGKMRFPSTDIRSFLFSPHKITSLSIINFCFVLWLLKLWLPESQMKSLVFSQGIFSFGFFPCSMRMCWRRILKDYNPKKISRSLQYIVSFYFS